MAILKRTINATGLIYFLYQLAEIVLSPAITLYLLYRGCRNPAYFAGLKERFGLLPSPTETTGTTAVWFHAVSVGEVLSTVELIRRLRRERPDWRVYVSTATLAGRAVADQKMTGLADAVFFAPLDYRWAVRRVLRRLRPSVLAVLETEIWPNLYREAKRAGASVLIVNGRISDAALPRYRRWRGFFSHVLRHADAILTQSEEDRRRFILAGAPADRVTAAGNLKYDFTPSCSITREIDAFIDRMHPKCVWIAASTMSDGVVDEDDVVIDALRSLPDVFLILAPRKPERFEPAAEKLERAKIPFARRSRGLVGAARVLLLDSIGELAASFARADVVFMGGTLADRGGHNILEPAFFAKPVIVGPHMENFAAIANEFEHAGAMERIAGPPALAGAVARLIADPARRERMGSKARELAMAKRGASSRAVARIIDAAAEAIPNPPRTLPARIVLAPLSSIWRAGNAIQALRPARALDAPVISVGALAMGGAGKTPVVAHLAARLRERGRNPAILTRGYKRKSRESVIVPRGERADRARTGDEARIFIRRGDAAVGIGADRYAVAQGISADVFLLDDGFQHRRLARRHDIVLIDAVDPWAGGVFPLGRLREPFQALRRATEIILTRCEPLQSTRGLERMIAQYTSAPVFRSRVAAGKWVSLDGAPPGDFGRAAAFCGLGTPRSFWRTLEQLGVRVLRREAFPDHHCYSARELARLAFGVDTLLTTGKDAANLPDEAARAIAPARLYWLEIEIEIEREDEFLKRIL
jgi:3-deoxy-D-manno-octulosonic-acid transferase